MHVVFCGGGTLGPVTPLIAVMRALRETVPDARASWIGTSSGPEAKIVAAAGAPFFSIRSGKLRRYFSWRNFVDPFRVLAGFFDALRLLGKLKPDVVVTAGGFVAVPVVWAAALKRIPVHVHQQDLRPGLANKLSAPFAASVSVAFEKSLSDFPRARPVWTGNPVRPELFAGSREDAVRAFGLEPGVPVVLVLGGGTGSVSLNELLRKSLPMITERAQVVHVAGAGKTAEVPAGTARYRQYELLTDDLRHAFAAADLVVTRAGMGVLTELAALGIPAVIVPIPGSHQEENARFFLEKGAAMYLDEQRTFSKQFADVIMGLLGDPMMRESMRNAMRALTKPDAAREVARLVAATAGRKG